jgi:hypothetical protein
MKLAHAFGSASRVQAVNSACVSFAEHVLSMSCLQANHSWTEGGEEESSEGGVL